MLRLKQQVERLESELDKQSMAAPAGSEGLAQGDDKLNVVSDAYCTDDWGNSYEVEFPKDYTWNALFGILAPSMIDEASTSDLRRRIAEHVHDCWKGEMIGLLRKRGCNYDGYTKLNVRIGTESFEDILIQLRALELIEMSDKPRSIKDTLTYWKMTPRGERLLVKLRAKRKEEESNS